jgi:hypothetical protein
MAGNEQEPQATLLAQAQLLQPSAQTQTQNGSLSRPTPFQPSAAEAQTLQNLMSNPPAYPTPNAQFNLPSTINDVGGQRGNGFGSADDAARAAAVPLQAYTQASGHEAGAWIVSRQVNGGERFFVVAPVQGQGAEIQPQDMNQAIQGFKRNDTNSEYTVVSNIHSHPLTRQDPASGRSGVIMEGPSSNDFMYWGGANLNGFPDPVNSGSTYRMQNFGYVVSGDGDVYRTDFRDLTQVSRNDLGNMANGRFTQNNMPTVSRIGDVTPTQGDDNALTANMRGPGTSGQTVRLPNGTQFLASDDWLPQSRVVDAVPRLSDPTHPDHRMYNQALQAVGGLDSQKVPFANTQERENAAAALVYAARRDGLSQIDHVTASNDGRTLFAVQGSPGDPAALITRPGVDKAQAVAQSMEATSERLLNDSPQFPAPRAATQSSASPSLDEPAAVARR